MTKETTKAAPNGQEPQAPKKKTVKLKTIFITNFKGIVNLYEEVDGNHFMVCGKNGAGKTSVAQAIARNAVRIDPKDIASLPIRIGAKSGEVKTTFIIDEDGERREILIEAIYRQSGAVVKVIDLNNKGELTPPVKTIQKLLGESHDVSSLMDLNPEEQFKELLKMLGGKITSDQFEERWDELYQRRKNLKKLVKDEEAFIKTIEPSVDALRDHRTQGLYSKRKPQEEMPAQPDRSAILVEKIQAENHNTYFDNRQMALTAVDHEIEELEKKLAEKKAVSKSINQWMQDNPKIDMKKFDKQEAEFEKSVEVWKKEVRKFNDYNDTVDKIAQYQSRKKILDDNQNKLADIQKGMDALDQQMKAAISSLKLEEIVPELTIKNELDESGYKPIWRKGIYYKNQDGSLLPFSERQISYGKMIVTLCKLSGYINHGKFNMFSIRAWNELDKSSKADILKFVEENPDLDLQLLIEAVEEKPLGIKIIEKISE